MIGYKALEHWLAKADAVDIAEGKLAYERYHAVMQRMAIHYGAPLDRTIAAFCALSPNNDYKGNLRSLASVLHGFQSGHSVDRVQVSTFRHCLLRAWSYVNGEASFEEQVKGPKIRAFYQNILDPADDRRATIDGHMSAMWHNENWTMSQAIIRLRVYREIESDVKALAFWHGMLPNQMQAILWFTRKRVLSIRYSAQGELFAAPDDMWSTLQHPDQIKPFDERKAASR